MRKQVFHSVARYFDSETDPKVVKKQFSGVLKELMTEYNTPENFDKLSDINYKMDIATKIMGENLEKAVQNLQDLEVIFFNFLGS